MTSILIRMLHPPAAKWYGTSWCECCPNLDEKSPKSKSNSRNKKISNLLLDDIELQRKGSLGSAALVSLTAVDQSGSHVTLKVAEIT